MNLFSSSSYSSIVPVIIVAGDFVGFKISATDYGTGYAMDMDLRPIAGGTPVNVTSTLTDGSYVFEIASATTAAYAVGDYAYALNITRESDSARITLQTGTLTVKPNPALSTADTRSHARKTLDAIRAVIEGRASQDQESYSIAGRSLSRTPIADLLSLETRYAQMVAAEDKATALANGQRTNSQIVVRMR